MKRRNTHVGIELLALLSHVAAGGHAPARKQHLEQGVPIAGEIEVDGLQHFQRRAEVLIKGLALLSGVLKDSHHRIGKGSRVEGNGDVALAGFYLDTTAAQRVSGAQAG